MKNLLRILPSSTLRVGGVVLLAAALTACGSSSTGSGSSTGSTSSTSTGSTSSSSGSSTGSSGAVVIPADYDHCSDGGFYPHATNGHIESQPAKFDTNQSSDTDLTVQPTVYNYMYKNGWQDAHVLWHQARGCGGFGAGSLNGLPSACNFTDLLPTQNDCAGARNGLEFLAAHKLMRDQLMELWPDHLEQFAGFKSFPKNRSDYAQELQGNYSAWDPELLTNADIAENIGDHLDMFPTEGDLGTWIQCAIMPNTNDRVDFSTKRNIHFALHNNGVSRTNQKHAVNNNNNNIDSYSFWQLHGWIDKVWMDYRAAKGKTINDQDYKDIMEHQCREMDGWREVAMEARGEQGHPNQDDSTPSIELDETGYFHDFVRPAFEQDRCATCHGAGEEAGLRLGFEISSTEIVERLVNSPSAYAEGYKLVVPGKPMESWLYLKAAGLSADSGATCKGKPCLSEMPNASTELLNNLKKWIEDGAQAPIIL